MRVTRAIKPAKVDRQPGAPRLSADRSPAIVAEVLETAGEPLDPTVRTRMEARFGHTFQSIRVHADPRAAESAQAVNARAYTVGRHIVFARGRYSPGTPAGDRLLAHELVHTLQQQGCSPPGATGLRIGEAGDAAERQADTAATLSTRAAVHGTGSSSAVAVTPVPTARVQREVAISGQPVRPDTESGQALDWNGLFQVLAETRNQEAEGSQPSPQRTVAGDTRTRPGAGGAAARRMAPHYLALQVVDDNGLRQALVAGPQPTHPSGRPEQDPVQALRTSVGGATDLRGGRLMIAADRSPLAWNPENRGAAFHRFAQDYGVAMEVRVPKREDARPAPAPPQQQTTSAEPAAGNSQPAKPHPSRPGPSPSHQPAARSLAAHPGRAPALSSVPAAKSAAGPKAQAPVPAPASAYAPRDLSAPEKRGAGELEGGRPGQPADRSASAAPDDDAPLRLADLFQASAASAAPAAPVVDTTMSAAAPAAPSRDAAVPSAATPVPGASTRAPAREPTPAEAVSNRPSPATALPAGTRSDSQATAERMEGYARRLEEALGTTREGLASAAKGAADQVRHDAANARSAVGKEVDNTLKRIDKGSRTLLDSVTSSLGEAGSRIDTLLQTHHGDVRQTSEDCQSHIRDMFDGHRKTVGDTVERNVAEGDKLRSDKQQAAKQRNRNDIRAAYRRGGAKMNSYGNTARGAYIGGAAFDVADETAKKMSEQEPDILSGIAEITAPLADDFRGQGAQALDGFDQNLPKILDSVTGAAGETDTDLDKQAEKARGQLDEVGRQTRDEINAIAADATAQVRAFKSQMDAQIDQALGQMLHELNATPARISGRVAPPVHEAIELLRTAQQPNPDAAAQLTDVLTGFLAETVTQTGKTLQQSGAKSTERFQQMSGGAHAAMRQQSERTDKIWKEAREGLASTLGKMTDGVDTGLGQSVTTLGDALDDTEKSIADQLSPVIAGLDGSFKDCLADAAGQIDQRIEDGFAKNTEALNELDGKMQEAADDAEFEWDHPVLSALEFLAGIIVGIVEVLAILLLLLVVTLIIASVLGVSMLVAGLIIIGAMAAFAIGYGFGARLAAGQGVGEAFLGSVVAFGRSVPGMLYDMTGIPKLRRAFSDEHMSPFQRGKLIGEGGTEFVLAVFAVRGAARGIASSFRKLRVPPVEAPTLVESEPRIGFGREGVRAAKPRPPGAGPSVQERIGFGREGVREAQPRPPDAAPGGQERIGFGREAVREAQPRPPPAADVPGATGASTLHAEMPRRVGIEIEPRGGVRTGGPAEGPAAPEGRSSLEVKASAASERPPGAPRSARAPEVRRGRVMEAPEEKPSAKSEAETEESSEGRGGRAAKGKGASEQAEELEGRGRRKRTSKKEAGEKRTTSKKGAKKKAAKKETAKKEPKPTKAEKRVQAKRDADTAAAQREFQGLEQQPKSNPSLEELQSGGEGGEPGAERGGATVRRGTGTVGEDLSVAQQAGSEFERSMVRDFAARQPKSAETFGSALGNWGRLKARFPRIAELFSGGERPDAVSVTGGRSRTIRLFDPTSRPNAEHMEGSVEYADRLVNDPEMQRQFGGWRVIIEERYWESGHTRRVFRVVRRIPGPAGAGAAGR